jgi:hypothetical protein
MIITIVVYVKDIVMKAQSIVELVKDVLLGLIIIVFGSIIA